MKFIYFIVAVAVSGLLVVGYLKYPVTDAASMAGWVQAVGSLIGIALAIWLSEVQAKRSRLIQAVAHAQRYAELYGPAIAIIKETMYEIEAAVVNAKAQRVESSFGVDPEFYTGRDDLKAAFFAIPIHQMPTVPSATSLLRVRRLFPQAEHILQRIGTKFDTLITVTNGDLFEVTTHLKEWQHELDTLQKDLVVATHPGFG